MKKLNVCLVVLLFFMMLAPITLFAQTTPPEPVCCPRGPEVVGQNQPGSLIIKGQLFITTGMLQSQGITKREFLERLSVSVFAGKAVDLVVSVKSTINQPRQGGIFAAAGFQGLVSVQETRVYRVPLYGLEPEKLEALDQFGLTDGLAQLNVKFVKDDSFESETN